MHDLWMCVVELLWSLLWRLPLGLPLLFLLALQTSRSNDA